MKYNFIKCGILIFVIIVLLFFGIRAIHDYYGGDKYRIVKTTDDWRKYRVEEKGIFGWDKIEKGDSTFSSIDEALKYIYKRQEAERPLNIHVELAKEKVDRLKRDKERIAREEEERKLTKNHAKQGIIYSVGTSTYFKTSTSSTMY